LVEDEETGAREDLQVEEESCREVSSLVGHEKDPWFGREACQSSRQKDLQEIEQERKQRPIPRLYTPSRSRLGITSLID